MLMSVSVQSRLPVARRYKRYIVSGSVVFQGPGGESRGALLNLGQGGVLVRTDAHYREGTDLTLRFQVGSDPETFSTLGQVVGTKADLLAIKFLEEPSEAKIVAGFQLLSLRSGQFR